MKRTILCVLFLFVLYLPAEAAYKIYLKNGSVIKGVSAYAEEAGKIRFYYGGGLVSLPSGDVLRIEETGEPLPPAEGPPVAAPEAPGQGAPAPETPPKDTARESALKERLSSIDSRLKEIEGKEVEAQSVEAEYERVRLRIELLFQQGRKAAAEAGRSQAEWFQFLPSQERQWAQMNSIKKNQLESQLETLKQELEPLREEKEKLLEEKRGVEDELKSLGG
jgi:hypothetical protein